MAIGESAGILFKIKGDSSDGVRAIKETQVASAQLTGTTASLTSSFSSLAVPALAVGAAVAVVTTAAIAATRAIFDLTKSTAEYGSVLFDAQQKTGLSALTLSALKFSADQTGSSFEQVTKGIEKFGNEVGKAADGNDKAVATMKSLNVTSGDMRTALGQAVKTIFEAKNETDRLRLATAAFGRAVGPDLIPLIIDAKGNLDDLEKNAKELGVTMTDEAIVASDELGDTLDLLDDQIDAVGRTIGTAFIPIVLDMARSLSNFVRENQSEIQAWATKSANFIRGLIDIYDDLHTSVKELEAGTHRLSGSYTAMISALAQNDPILRGIVFLWEKWAGSIDAIAKRGADAAGLSGFVKGVIGPTLPTIGDNEAESNAKAAEDARKKAEREREKARREAERLEERDLASAIRIEATNLRTVQQGLQAAYEAMRKTLSDGGTVKGFAQATNETTKQWAENINRSLVYLEELEKRALSKDATANERAELEQKQLQRRHELKLKQDAEIKANEDKQWEIKLERGEIEASMAQRLFDIEQDRIEQYKTFLESLGEGGLGENFALTALKPSADSLGDPDETLNPFEHFLTGWQLMYDTIMSDAPTLQDTLESLGNIVGRAFDGMANAIGNMVQQWVLYGTTAPAIMRKILASALATIAAEAAVRAIYELAMGFASLAVQDYEGAAFHFGSAALFGTIAAVAAIAGRVVAGNAFKQQTATATGGASGNQRSSSSEGGAYSSLPDQTYETGINSPGIQGSINVKIGLDSDGVLTLLEQNARNNGRFRGLVLRLADGA